MPVLAENLWTLAQKGQPIDAAAFAAALEREAGDDDLDYRTRLLIRDGLDALAGHWGKQRITAWVAASPTGEAMERIWRAEFEKVGFPSLRHRIMDATRAETVLEFFDELGARLLEPARLEVGGVIALILGGLLSRNTREIDLMNEAPPGVWTELEERYGLRFRACSYPLPCTQGRGQGEGFFRESTGQVRSVHAARGPLTPTLSPEYRGEGAGAYLPAGWRDRLHSRGHFGQLDVWLVDACDIFIGKLFSSRAKDCDDLRALTPHFDKPLLIDRLRDTAGALLADELLARNAADNWYILYGETLTVPPR